MIVKVDKKEFLNAIQTIYGVITLKNMLPVLSNILIQTKNNNIELMATDLDVGMITEINAEVMEEGGITVPAKKFLEIIKELPEHNITITAKKNNTINIECENTFFKIVGIPKEEFPKIPKQTNKNKTQIQQQKLKQILLKTIFAVSHDETRYVLNGVLLTIKGKEINLVATDGRRLVVLTEENTQTQQQEIKSIIPAKTIQEVIRIIKEEGDAFIYFDDTQIIFEIEKVIIVSRLIEGEFPNYEQAIPKQKTGTLNINKIKFLTAIKRASLLTTPDSQSIKIDIFKTKTIISKHTPNMGEVKEEIESAYTGEEFFIGFNPSYLIEGIKNINSEDLLIEFYGPEKPAIIKDSNRYFYIVLPMQIV